MKASSTILPLTSAETSLDKVGGKGAALAKLVGAELPVPEGFCITVDAYQAFIAAHGIDECILNEQRAGSFTDLSTLQAAAERIQEEFERFPIDTRLHEELHIAYVNLGDGAVAVRSSATAEDLPNQSFAGQHNSYLNISGMEALTSHVLRCWASLWNAQAISYRERAGIDHQQVAMAVVVQVMVPADLSGVLFTQDPNNQHLGDMLIDAHPGSGEALVAGEVMADQFRISRDTFSVREQTLAAAETSACLNAPQLKAIAQLGSQVEKLFNGVPQDIEWSMCGDTLWLLQSRPITTLQSDTLSWDAPYPGAQLMRRQVVENMPAPLSPLFETLYLNNALDVAMDSLAQDMDLPVSIDEFVTRPLFITVNGYGYCRYDFKAHWGAVRHIPKVLWWYIRVLPRWLKTLLPHWQEQGLPGYLATVAAWRERNPTELNPTELFAGIEELTLADAEYWYQITVVMGAAKVFEGMFDVYLQSRLMRKAADGTSSGALLRGFDSPTLDAQHQLAHLAAHVQAHPALLDLVTHTAASELLATLQASSTTAGARHLLAGIEEYLEAHGHQVYNLDFAAPTQAEEPTPIMLSLQSMANSPDPEGVLARRQATMQHERALLREQIPMRLGPIRRRLFNTLLNWAEQYAPYREHALHYMGAAWPMLRTLAHELGARLVTDGCINDPQDVYYLTADEIRQWLRTPEQLKGSVDLVAKRQELQKRQRRTHPPARVPEDLRFKFGRIDVTRFLERWETQKRNTQDSDKLSGFAVSPGQVTGIASVVLDPSNFSAMLPNTILVCPTTTPAWTPLFGSAIALVTDIGAPLAHGSIVAREYGIPAVLGTGNATQRIRSGQRITVDGNRGSVEIFG